MFRKNERTETKKRQAKATSAQIDYMVDYFVQHPHVATGRFQSLHGNADLRGSWEQLVTDLNSMGKDGKTKDIKSWKSVSELIKIIFKILCVTCNCNTVVINVSDMAR